MLKLRTRGQLFSALGTKLCDLSVSLAPCWRRYDHDSIRLSHLQHADDVATLPCCWRWSALLRTHHEVVRGRLLGNHTNASQCLIMAFGRLPSPLPMLNTNFIPIIGQETRKYLWEFLPVPLHATFLLRTTLHRPVRPRLWELRNTLSSLNLSIMVILYKALLDHILPYGCEITVESGQMSLSPPLLTSSVFNSTSCAAISLCQTGLFGHFSFQRLASGLPNNAAWIFYYAISSSCHSYQVHAPPPCPRRSQGPHPLLAKI